MITLYGLLLALSIVLFIVFRKIGLTKKKEQQKFDPRKDLEPNATNYNLSTYDRSDLEKMDKQELLSFLEKERTNEISSLSLHDFDYIKRRLKEEG